jgi:Cu-Zn family superoxide dismutase
MTINFSRWPPLLALIGLAAACQTQATTAPAASNVTVPLKNAQGQVAASVVIIPGLSPSVASGARVASSARTASDARTASAPRQASPEPSGVTLVVTVTDLPPGTHGFHVRSVARCDPPDFITAGPILNPDGRAHGVRSPNGPEAGDLPNLTVDSDHSLFAAFFVGHLSMSQLSSAPNGTSLVIDSGPDDDLTQPNGSSGTHIACGVISAAPTASPSPGPARPTPASSARSA